MNLIERKPQLLWVISSIIIINPRYPRYIHVYVCCTALMRPNQAETALSAVVYSLVSHDD